MGNIRGFRLNGRETIYLSSISNKLDSFTSNKEAIEFMKNMPTTNKGFDLGKLSIKLNDGTRVKTMICHSPWKREILL